MLISRFARTTISLVCVLCLVTPANSAGLLLLDFGTRTGEAEGWDIIDEVPGIDECNYLEDEFTPCTIFELTDRAGSDDDVTLEILERPFIGNTAPHLAEDQVYDGLGVPVAAHGDYHYRDPDTAGSTAPFRFSNIDPGIYNVTVFEGRTTDGNGQFAKLWVGDFNGSNEPGEFGQHEGKNTDDFAAGAATVTLEIAEGDYLWYRHLEDNSGGIAGIIIRSQEGGPLPVEGRGTVGSNIVSGTRANQMFSDPGDDYVAGLGQSWYAVGNPASKAGVDAVAAANERAVPYFQAEGTSWWTGSSDEIETIPAYPAQVLADPFPFEGDETNINNYTTHLSGQIKIDESGTIQFLDGNDDYTYLAIDVDGSGTIGDSDGEVLLDDNAWTNALSSSNGGAPIVEATFENIPDEGVWRNIEINVAEGGGGDSGIFYWDVGDEDEVFPLDQGEGIFDAFDAEELVIPDTHLRSTSTPPQLLSGDFSGSVPSSPSGWEIDVNPADGTADSFSLQNPDADIYTTILDVEGAEIHINALGDVADGAAFKIFDVDQVTGSPTILTEGWSFDAASGSVVFGTLSLCNADSMGDLDGDGTVNFLDFLALAQNFGQPAADHTAGDIDCDGTVSFLDFLALAQNFGSSVSANAEAVPEPTGAFLLCLGLACLGLQRKRRK